jgi:hypothetical protein
MTISGIKLVTIMQNIVLMRTREIIQQEFACRIEYEENSDV